MACTMIRFPGVRPHLLGKLIHIWCAAGESNPHFSYTLQGLAPRCAKQRKIVYCGIFLPRIHPSGISSVLLIFLDDIPLVIHIVPN